MRRTIALLFSIALLGVNMIGAPEVQAKIYKYKDAQGKIHYTNDLNNVPPEYRNQNGMKVIREFPPPVPKSETSEDSAGNDKEADSATETEKKEKEGLSPGDEAKVKEAIRVLEQNVKMVRGFDGVIYNFTNGMRLTNAIQGALPAKEALAKKLSGAKLPVLVATRQFLEKSIAADRETQSVGAGLPTQVAAIFSRVRADADAAEALVSRLKKELEESDRKKKAARKDAKKGDKKDGKKNGKKDARKTSKASKP